MLFCQSHLTLFYLKESESVCKIENKDINEKGDIVFEKEEVASGKISISEAEIVVSAGRGLKGPENWNMIEELAEELGLQLHVQSLFQI